MCNSEQVKTQRCRDDAAEEKVGIPSLGGRVKGHEAEAAGSHNGGLFLLNAFRAGGVKDDYEGGYLPQKTHC